MALVICALFLFSYKASLVNFPFMAGREILSKGVGITIEVFLWLSFGWLATGLVRFFLLEGWERQSGRHTPKLLRDIINSAIIFATLLIILGFVFNAPISGLIAGSSVVAAIVGLAITRMISDVFSGVALSLERGYSIGDWLEIEIRTRASGYITGKVVEINWRATRLHTKADEIIIVPNSEMARMKFINFSIPEKHYRAEVQVSLSHTIPSERIKRILKAATRSTPGIMKDPAPKITLLKFDQRGVLWSTRFWVSDFSLNRQVVKAAHESVLKHLQIAGIDISYNRVDQRLIQSGVEELNKKPIKEALVKRIELFEIIDGHYLQQIADNMQERRFAAKKNIVSQGHAGSSLYIVAEGLVRILVTDENGKKKWVANIEPGRYFGEMSLLTGEPRSATAQADTEVICYEITKDNLMPIFQEQPHLLEKISKIMAERQAQLCKIQEGEDDQTCEEEKEKTTNWLLRQMHSFFGITR